MGGRLCFQLIRFHGRYVGMSLVFEFPDQSYDVFEVNSEIEAKSLLSYIYTKFANCYSHKVYINFGSLVFFSTFVP